MNTYPISEIFGATISGEGERVGDITHFVRFAGCNFDCSWALVGNTKVLTPDMRQVELHTLRPGDDVVGYVRPKEAKTGPLHMEPTKVLSATKVPSKSTLAITLDDGSCLTATGEHRFWEEKVRNGWAYKPRYRIGLEGNYVRADRLKVDQWLKGFGSSCLMTKPRTDEWFHGYMVGAMMGDGHVGSEWIGLGATEESFVETVVLASRHVGTPLHRLSDTETNRGTPLFKIRLGEVYRSRFEELYEWKPEPEFCRGFLAGIFDAEGTVPTGASYFTNKDLNVVSLIEKSLLICGFDLRTYSAANDVLRVEVVGGTDEQVRFATSIDFACESKRISLAFRGLMNCRRQIVDIQPGSDDVELYDIQTESRNFFAEGILAHNCDTRYAVNPKYEGWHVVHMEADSIVEKLKALPGSAGWVTLSGGNPALFLDDQLVIALHQAGYKISMETQWLPKYSDAFVAIDHLVYSPKPPSSGMDTRYDRGQWDIISKVVVDRCIKRGKGSTSIKTVIFDERDLEWAKRTEQEVTARVPMDDGWIPLILSVGTPTNPKWGLIDVRDNICEATLQILAMVRDDPYFKNHRIVPQLHAILWGRRKGV